MHGIGFSMKLSPHSVQAMKEFAKTFPEKVQKRVFKRAGKVAAEAMTDRIKALMPYNKNPKYKKPRPHMRDVVAFKTKTYRTSGRTLFIMGYKSKTTRLQTLVEKGNFLTSPRMTAHQSNTHRRRVAAGMKREKYQLANGSWRYRMVKMEDNLRSTGSRPTEARGHAHSTGDFPKSKQPFAPITKATNAMKSEVLQILEREIFVGFERAFGKEAGNW